MEIETKIGTLIEVPEIEKVSCNGCIFLDYLYGGCNLYLLFPCGDNDTIFVLKSSENKQKD